MKQANVTPIPKVHPPRSIQSDVRPISLTPTISKYLESFIGSYILETIKDKLDPNQYGAIKGLSTTHALIDLLHHLHEQCPFSKHIQLNHICEMLHLCI